LTSFSERVDDKRRRPALQNFPFFDLLEKFRSLITTICRNILTANFFSGECKATTIPNKKRKEFSSIFKNKKSRKTLKKRDEIKKEKIFIFL
jgi:hypothetical protein